MSDLFLEVLKLNSFFPFLTSEERFTIHRLRCGDERKVPDKVNQALTLIRKHCWRPPRTKIGQDKITYYEDDAFKWRMQSEYQHPISEHILKLK